MPLWINNGKLVIDDTGALVLCDTCPCDSGTPGEICDVCRFEVASVTLTLSGVVNSGCADCQDYNGVPIVIPRDGSFASNPCSGSTFIFDDCPIIVYWQMVTSGTTYELHVGVGIFSVDGFNMQQTIAIEKDVDGKVDCTAFGGSYSPSPTHHPVANCDWSSVDFDVAVNLA